MNYFTQAETTNNNQMENQRITIRKKDLREALTMLKVLGVKKTDKSNRKIRTKTVELLLYVVGSNILVDYQTAPREDANVVPVTTPLDIFLEIAREYTEFWNTFFKLQESDIPQSQIDNYLKFAAATRKGFKVFSIEELELVDPVIEYQYNRITYLFVGYKQFRSTVYSNHLYQTSSSNRKVSWDNLLTFNLLELSPDFTLEPIRFGIDFGNLTRFPEGGIASSKTENRLGTNPEDEKKEYSIPFPKGLENYLTSKITKLNSDSYQNRKSISNKITKTENRLEENGKSNSTLEESNTLLQKIAKAVETINKGMKKQSRKQKPIPEWEKTFEIERNKRINKTNQKINPQEDQNKKKGLLKNLHESIEQFHYQENRIDVTNNKLLKQVSKVFTNIKIILAEEIED